MKTQKVHVMVFVGGRTNVLFIILLTFYREVMQKKKNVITKLGRQLNW